MEVVCCLVERIFNPSDDKNKISRLEAQLSEVLNTFLIYSFQLNNVSLIKFQNLVLSVYFI
jgi:hypothetical protein